MPQRITRLVRAVAIIGLASLPVVALGAPAFAGTAGPSVRSREWWLRTMHVIQAWRSGEGAGITVAVLADGVDGRQPDIAGSVIQGPDFTSSGRHLGGPHFGLIGTSLASLIAGHGHGKKNARNGMLGIVPQAKILSVRVTLSPGDPLWTNSKITSRLPAALAAGIRYAVNNRAQVIELPPDPGLPGLGGWGGVTADAGGSAAERAAIRFALRRDVMLVAPAGDNAQAGDGTNYPAAYPGVISVGAFGSTFVKAPFSNRQSYVTLTAAGQGVIAATATSYRTMNSTWAASAIAAGVAALLRSQFPSLTATQVKTAMTSGTRFHSASGRQDGSGYGTLDATKAVDVAGTISPPHAVLATRGALPRVRPVPPRAESLKSVILADLARDGEIAAAIFAALLLLIVGYKVLSRRTAHRAAIVPVMSGDDQARSEPQGMLADPLLEFFGPLDARPDERPASQRPLASPRYQPRPTLTGRSTLSGRPALPGTLAASGQGTPSGLAGAPMAQVDWMGYGTAEDDMTAAAMLAAQGGAGGVTSPHAPDAIDRPGESGATFRWAHRTDAHNSLRARVTGGPPWEPAPEPTTELPWAVLPNPVGGTAPRPVSAAPTRQAPPESLWNDAASGPPAAVPAFEPTPPPAGGDPQRAAAERSEAGSGGRPIYVWNPTGGAEPFPAVSEEPRQPG